MNEECLFTTFAPSDTLPTHLWKAKTLKELERLLKPYKESGKIGLVVDPSLTSLLSLVVGYNILQSFGVDKIYRIQNGPLETECTNVIYLTKPVLSHMKIIAGHIHQFNNIYSTTPSPKKKIRCFLRSRKIYHM